MVEVLLTLFVCVAYLIGGYYAWDLGSGEEDVRVDGVGGLVLRILFLPALLIIWGFCALLCKVMGWGDKS